MTRVDAHQHYWSLQRGDYAWLTAGEVTLYRDFTPEDLSGQLADCAVGATVLVQAAATEAETRFLFGLARAHASIAGVVGWVDFAANDVEDRVRSLVREGGGNLDVWIGVHEVGGPFDEVPVVFRPRSLQ